MRGRYFYGFIIAATVGVVALHAFLDAGSGEKPLDHLVGARVTLEGVVAEDPVMTAKNQKIVFKVEGERGKVIAFAPLYPSLAYGDAVIARGIIREPESFTTESGRIFNYPAYLAKDGIAYILDKPTLTREGEWRGSTVKRFFITLRHSFVDAIGRAIPEPYAGLAAGVVLGVDGALSKEDEALFRDAGLVHIIVVSGYNITLVGDTIARLLSSFPSAIASLGSLAGIVAFIMLTGTSATAVRAGIMALLVLVARLTKRRYNMQRALFVAGFLMVVHNPAILLHDPSFQLSFLATWGLGTLTPLTQRLFRWVPVMTLRDIAATTLATQTAVAPLLFHMSGKIQPLALPANILVLPIMPVFMASTLVIGSFGFLPATLLLPATLVVQSLGAYIFTIARMFGA